MKMNMAAGGEKSDIDSKISADVINSPEVAMDMKMKMTNAGTDMMDMQMVLTKDGLYVNAPGAGWTALPKEQADQMLTGSLQESIEPAKQIEQLKEFASDFSLTESGDAYTLKLSAKGDKFQKFLQEEVKKQLAGQEAAGDAIALESLKFNQVEYTIVIDKKTGFPKNLDAIMDFEMSEQGQTVTMKIDLKSTFSKFNEIKEIKAPEGAK